MEQEYVFQTGPVDMAVMPQLSQALEHLTRAQSRAKMPRLWKVIDRFDRSGKSSDGKPHLSRILLPVVIWVLALILLVPGLSQPADQLLMLVVGAAAMVVSLNTLRKTNRKLMAALSLAAGIFLALAGALTLPDISGLLPAGLVLVIVGIITLITGGKQAFNSFQKTARDLIEQRNAAPASSVTFTETALAFPDASPIPYSGMPVVYQTADLLVPICGNRVLILRRDALYGDYEEFRSFLDSRTAVVEL